MPDLEPIDRCPVCGSGATETLFIMKRVFAGEDLEFPLGNCKECGTRRFLKRLPRSLSGEAYGPGYLWLDEGGDKIFKRLGGWYRNQSLDHELDCDLKTCGPLAGGRILDYGAGTGDRLLRMRRRGLAATGYEPFSASYREAAPFIYRDLETLLAATPDGYLDMIQFNHTLAHLHLLEQDLEGILVKLKPGGWIVVRTPNPESLQARWFGSRWHAADPLRMLYFFPARALKTLFGNHSCQWAKTDHSFHALHPPTLALSLFPGLDPVSGNGGGIRKILWGLATLAAIPPAAIESSLGKASVLAAYFRKGSRTGTVPDTVRKGRG